MKMAGMPVNRVEAERLYRRALQLDPSFEPAKHNLAQITGGR